MVFGVDIATPFQEWMRNVFTPKFHAVHPNDEFAGYIVEPGASFNPSSSALGEVLCYTTTTTDADKYMGLIANVRHKHQYSARTGQDSSTVGDNFHLVVSGDYPYDGFLFHRGIPAGGSGVRKEFDVVYVREIVDKYIELRTAIVREVIAIIDWAESHYCEDIGRWKYLNGDLQTLSTWRQAYIESFG
jgi:hypothetical protein